jgi:peptidoglycan/LPS O-acetylase OafA/YrhL
LKKFRALESWRGICAIGVVLFHISLASHIRGFTPVRNANLGVDFFFVLSGFVLGHAYSARLSNLAAAREFVIRRIGRLLPLHLFALGILVLLELSKLFLVARFDVSVGAPPFTGATGIGALVASIFLVNGLGFIPYFAWNGPSWSVSTEFWVYLVFLVACLGGLKKYRLTASLLALACGLAFLYIAKHNIKLHTYNGLGLLSCLYGFSCGNVLNILYGRLTARNIAPSRFAEYIALAVIVAIFFGLAPWQHIVAPLGFGFAILIFAFERGPVSRALMMRVPEHLGLVSYSIYLMHMPILAIVSGIARTAQSKLHVSLYVPRSDGQLLLSFGNVWINDAAVLLLVLVIVGLASLTYHAIESPGRKYFNKLANQNSANSRTLLPDSQSIGVTADASSR